MEDTFDDMIQKKRLNKENGKEKLGISQDKLIITRSTILIKFPRKGNLKERKMTKGKIPIIKAIHQYKLSRNFKSQL